MSSNPSQSHAQIASRICRFVSGEILNGEGTVVSPDLDLLTNGVVDSMGYMRLVAFVETEFDIGIPMRDVSVENFTSCNTIASYLLSRVEATGR